MTPRSSEQEDYILRMMRMAAEALRRLRGRLIADEPAELIRKESLSIAGDLLGRDAPLLRMVDARNAVQLVGHPGRVAVWIDILELEADATDRTGDSQKARVLRDRAASLRSEAVALWGELPGTG